MLVLIAESRTRSYLASIVPVIVNTVLNEHQLVLDIVAFVSKGDFPRSRLGEKQRGKILASWVSRKMQTIAQFSIRDPDAEGSVGTAVPEEMGRRSSAQSGLANTRARHSQGSFKRAPGTAGSSLRHVESVSQMPIDDERPPAPTLPLHIEPREYDEDFEAQESSHKDRNDETPTNERPRPLTLDTNAEFNIVDAYDHSPVDNEENSPEHPRDMNTHLDPYSQTHSHGQYHMDHDSSHAPDVSPLRFEDFNASPGPTGFSFQNGMGQDFSPVSPLDVPGLRGGLRVANAGDNDADSEEDWGASALKDLNIGAPHAR